MSYKDKLRDFCRDSGYKKQHIAKKMGISYVYLWRLHECEEAHPSPAVAELIERFTEGTISRDEIMKERDTYMKAHPEQYKRVAKALAGKEIL